MHVRVSVCKENCSAYAHGYTKTHSMGVLEDTCSRVKCMQSLACIFLTFISPSFSNSIVSPSPYHLVRLVEADASTSFFDGSVERPMVPFRGLTILLRFWWRVWNAHVQGLKYRTSPLPIQATYRHIWMQIIINRHASTWKSWFAPGYLPILGTPTAAIVPFSWRFVPIVPGAPTVSKARALTARGAIYQSIYLYIYIIYTGWWLGPPLWKIWKSIGMIVPNIWENKKCIQTTIQYTYKSTYLYIEITIYIYD